MFVTVLQGLQLRYQQAMKLLFLSVGIPYRCEVSNRAYDLKLKKHVIIPVRTGKNYDH